MLTKADDNSDVRQSPQEYSPAAGRIARLQVGKWLPANLFPLRTSRYTGAVLPPAGRCLPEWRDIVARIRIEDLPTVENLTPEEQEEIFGAGRRSF
jgi:hypothetical protein